MGCRASAGKTCASDYAAERAARRCASPIPSCVEATIRPIFSPEDFGKELTPELRVKEEELRKHLPK